MTAGFSGEVIAGLCRHLAEEVPQVTRLRPRESAGVEQDWLSQVLRPGTILEWITNGPGQCGLSLVFTLLAQQEQRTGSVVIIDRRRTFFWPAIAACGLEPEQIFLVRPEMDTDALWATEQSLRSAGVTAVICLGLEIPAAGQGTVYRRFQLAAQTGQTCGIVISQQGDSRGIRWADRRLKIEQRPGSLRRHQRELTLRQIGGRVQGIWESHERHQEIRITYDELTGQMTHEQHRLPVPAAVADSASQTRKAGA